MAEREFFIKDTHRGVLYEDGVLARVLGAGWQVGCIIVRSPPLGLRPAAGDPRAVVGPGARVWKGAARRGPGA